MILDYLLGYKRKFEALKVQYDYLYDQVERMKRGFDQARDLFTIRTRGLEQNINTCMEHHRNMAEKYWALKEKYEPEQAAKEKEASNAEVAKILAESTRLVAEVDKAVGEMKRDETI